MSEALHARRRADRLADGAATLATAAFLALGLALALKALAWLAGLLVGDASWRSWVQGTLSQSVQALQEWPVLGDVLARMGGLEAWLPAQDLVRDLVALVIVLFPLCLAPARRIGPVLIARFDDEALRPPPPADLGLRWAGPLGPRQQAAWTWLQRWCFEGAGDGRAPWWKPWALPAVEQRFSLALLAGANGVGKSHLAEAFARHLDGTDLLAAAPGRWARWRLRLLVKVHDCLWWRARQPADPWDCGYLVNDPAPLARLREFLPRRATLLVADELQTPALLAALQTLAERRTEFRHPVRLLVLDAALPAALGLAWDAARTAWHTELHELGEVAVFDPSDTRFGVAQFRGLVGAQRQSGDDAHLRLDGEDHAWQDTVEALDGQPVLLAEAVRLVQERALRFEDLQRQPGDAPGTVLRGQDARATPRLPPDLLGKQRDLLRERVIGARARHREQLLRALLADAEAYEALLVATLANGGSASRLGALFGWTTRRLEPERLAQAFVEPIGADWIPPVKPAAVADELLRLHFRVPRGTELDDGTRQRVAARVREAWLLNPEGMLRTAARWQGRAHADGLAQALVQLPEAADLEQAAGLASPLRIELARAFLELAVLHHGDVGQAIQAMQRLDAAELAGYELVVQGLLKRPDALGLPALVLWLHLLRRRWPDLQSMPVQQAEAFGSAQLRRLCELLDQCIVASVHVTPALTAALDEAVSAVLPLVGQLAAPCGESAAFAQAARTLLHARCSGADEVRFLLGRMRQGLERGVAGRIARLGRAAVLQEPHSWQHFLLRELGALPGDAAATAVLDLRSWPAAEDATGPDNAQPAGARRIAQALALFAQALDDNQRDLIAQLAHRVAVLAANFPLDESLQESSAKLWLRVAFAQAADDSAAAADAARKVDALARRFANHLELDLAAASAWRRVVFAHFQAGSEPPAAAMDRMAELARRHAGERLMQRQAVAAWCYLAHAARGRDAAASEHAAEQAARIAEQFPDDDEIQLVHAEAWESVALTHREADARPIERAIAHIEASAQRFPRHEQLQWTVVTAWDSWACALKEEAGAAKRAAERMAPIADRFPWSGHIHAWYTQTLRMSAWAHVRTAPLEVRRTAHQVARIAEGFPDFEELQYQSAVLWRYLAWAHDNTDAAATEQAVHRVDRIARRFPRYQNTQRECAEAWRHLAWAFRNTDLARVRQAIDRLAEIAANDPAHEPIRTEEAMALQVLAWSLVHAGEELAAIEAVVQRLAELARQFPASESIQFESAQAWRHLAWAFRRTDCAATERAAECAARIAEAFPDSERIQHESALAWRLVIEAAVRFDDGPRIERALAELDALAGERRQGFQQVWQGRAAFASVAEERTAARATVQRWRESRSLPGAAEIRPPAA